MNHNYQLSPPQREVKTALKDEEVPPAFLVLGAFSATRPKIHFETVVVGQSKKRTLIVRNPNETACFLRFVKRPSSVFELNYGSEEPDTDLFIPALDQLLITITWTPKEEGQCFEAFQVQPSTGGTRLSVHLLGKALAPPKKPGAKRRPGTALPNGKFQPIPPKANDPSLQLTFTKPKTQPPPSKLTIPHSPNFTTRFNSKTSHTSSSDKHSSGDSTDTQIIADSQNIVPEEFSAQQEDQEQEEQEQRHIPKTPTAMDKFNTFSLPFTPEPTSRNVNARLAGGGDHADIPEEQQQDEPVEKKTHQTNFIEKNDPQLSALASPARRETYLVAPSPMVRNTNVPPLEDCPSARQTFRSQLGNGHPQNSSENGEKAHDTSASIELDSNILDNITKTLDNDLDLAAVYRSMDTILDNVQQKSTTAAAFTGLTELNEESYMDLPIDLEEEDNHLAGKAGSGEFLCMDHLDLVPNFPQGDVKLETELMTSIKQMLKDGKTKDEIIESHLENENYLSEIRALYEEMGNKYKSCRECYEVVKSFHLSEAFTFHRIVIKKAIEDGEIVIKDGIDIRNFALKTKVISSLLCSYSRPWLWSALCLVFNNDKLHADDIDMMNFIDENLFWNNELLDLGDPADGHESPKEFLELLAPRFLQKYLEILYLLDATEIPTVFYSNLTTKQFLDKFAVEFLGAGSVENIVKKIPIKLTQNVDPIQYLIEENLRGPNLLAWTNIVRLVQELVNNPEGPEVSCNSSSVEAAKDSLRVALQEAEKIGVPCQIEENQFDWFFHGATTEALDEKFLWQLVLRIRIAQSQKLQGREE